MADQSGMMCADNLANTGDNLCNPELEMLESYISIAPGREYTPEETADGDTFMAALQADLYNPNKSLRAYIFKGASGVEPGVTEATSETGPYGKIRSLLDAQVNVTFTFWNKGNCWYSKALEFNRKTDRPIIMIGKDGTITAYKLRNGNYTGYKMCDVLINAPTMASGTAGVMQTHRLTFNDYQNDYGKNYAFIRTNNASKDLLGLSDIYLKNITSTIPGSVPVGTYYIQVLGSCGGTDIAAMFISKFQTLTQGTPWISYNNTTGPAAVINISAATYSTQYKAVVLAFNTTDTDWITGDDIHLGLATTDALNAQGIIGFEANPNYIILLN